MDNARKAHTVHCHKDLAESNFLVFAVVVLCCLFSFFFPTSLEGEGLPIFQSALYAIAFVLVLFFLFLNGARVKGIRFLLAAALILYLFVASIYVVGSGVGRFSFARVTPVLLIVSLFVLNHGKAHISAQSAVKTLDFILIVVILWNFTAMMHLEPFEQFILDFYSQLDEYTATAYSLLVGKPIFTFGVHNFAAAFYSFLFLLCIQVHYALEKRRMLVYGGALLFFTLMLKSAASYISFAFMVVFFVLAYYRHRETSIPLIVPISLACVVGAVFLMSFPQIAERLFFSSTNGFGARYLADGLYFANYEILRLFPLGIGFSIVDGLWYADSGFIIYLTMGGILGLVLLLLLLWGYCKDNIPDPFIRYSFIVVVIICELSFSSVLYWKTMFCFVFFAVISTSVSRLSEKTSTRSNAAKEYEMGTVNEI